MRSTPSAHDAVLVLGTQGAPPRQRRAREVESADAEPVPTSRATVVRPSAFGSSAEASGWLGELRASEERIDAELEWALGVLNRALSARRLAAADAYLSEVSFDRALVARLGYGDGEAVADGRFAAALELPRPGARRVRRSMESPDERFAALLGARETPLAAEELVLRARADLTAGRGREAALQARVALEALATEAPAESAAPLTDLRAGVAGAANAALTGKLSAAELEAVTEAVRAMESELRRHRLGG